MNVAKLVIPAVLIAIVYFAFFATSMPSEIEYRGHTLGPRERVTNNSTRNFDIFSYRDKTNHYVLLFVMATDETATVQQLLDVYIKNFKAQGYEFRERDGRYLGKKDDEVIYMTKALQIESAVAYVEKSPDASRAGFRNGGEIFSELEAFAF